MGLYAFRQNMPDILEEFLDSFGNIIYAKYFQNFILHLYNLNEKKFIKQSTMNKILKKFVNREINKKEEI